MPIYLDIHRYLLGSELVTSGVCWTHSDNRIDVNTSETNIIRSKVIS